jgi:predicted DNA-binding transcriptional regulator AlpA
MKKSYERAARYLTASDLCARWGVSRAKIHRDRCAGYIPQPVRLGARSVKWSLEEVEQFEARLAADRGLRRAA